MCLCNARSGSHSSRSSGCDAELLAVAEATPLRPGEVEAWLALASPDGGGSGGGGSGGVGGRPDLMSGAPTHRSTAAAAAVAAPTSAQVACAALLRVRVLASKPENGLGQLRRDNLARIASVKQAAGAPFDQGFDRGASRAKRGDGSASGGASGGGGGNGRSGRGSVHLSHRGKQRGKERGNLPELGQARKQQQLEMELI